MSIGWSLFFRMAIELNRVLPPSKRIPLIEFRNHISEIRRLYEDSFPEGVLSMAWMTLLAAGGIALGSAVIVELIRTSR
jgi:hypothetical protein